MHGRYEVYRDQSPFSPFFNIPSLWGIQSQFLKHHDSERYAIFYDPSARFVANISHALALKVRHEFWNFIRIVALFCIKIQVFNVLINVLIVFFLIPTSIPLIFLCLPH